MSAEGSDVRQRLGEAIRDARRAMDPPMTQRDLARAVGVRQPSVSAWELGKTMPSPHIVLTPVRLFNLDLAVLADPPRRRRLSPGVCLVTIVLRCRER